MSRILKIKAFSLIEMLLVIAILSALVSLGLVFANKYAQQVKVEKTALEINHILEAGIKYYTVNNKWPDFPLDANNPFKKYLTLNDLKNPWGGVYEYANSVIKFKVTTELPSSALATRVLDLLPNGYIDGTSNKKVIAEISSYMQSESSQVSWLINDIGSISLMSCDVSSPPCINALGKSQNPVTVNVRACPLGWTQKLITTPRNIEFATIVRSASLFFPTVIGAADQEISCSNNPMSKFATCKIDVFFQASLCQSFSNRGSHLLSCEADAQTIAMTGPTTAASCYRWSQCDSEPIMKNDGKIELYYISYCEKQSSGFNSM